VSLGWIVTGLAVLLSGCGTKIKSREGAVSDPIPFSRIKAAVLQPYCLGCHAANERPFLNTYTDVKDSLASIRRAVFTTRTMPKRGDLPEDEQAMLLAWIDQGAPELPEVVTPPPSHERKTIKWADLQKQVFQPRCVVCHFPNNPDRLSDLQDYESARAIVGSLLFLSVASDKMPPPPAGTPEENPNPNKLSAAEKETLAYWVIDGMQK